MIPLASAAAAAEIAPPLWSVIPFAALLLSIAVLPLTVPHFWHHTRNQLIVSALWGLPAAIYLLGFFDGGGHHLLESIKEYVAFIVLLGTLFIVSGGIYLRGSLAGTPIVNTAFLAVGAIIASFIGTTGAATLLIRPLLRANEKRERKKHLVVFFIFVVCNAGGMLTPLGDPPLFLGFLRGVPFLWTFRLFMPWLLVNGLLILLFNVVDQVVLNREERERKGSQLEQVQQIKEPLGVDGAQNFLFLLGVILVIFFVGSYGHEISSNHDVLMGLQIAGMGLMAGLSWWTTRRSIRVANRFSWAPIAEVAVLFGGIFVTMVPALQLLQVRGSELGVTQPWQFFWATGLLSSFLDNAPTYLVFLKLGQGAHLLPADLATVEANLVLMAISAGAVFMGANTYIGNGPNFMIKAIAEEAGVKMPSFFGYMVWSIGILVPIFVGVTFIFFRG